MPKRALLLYFSLALVGAAVFVWFSFPFRPNKFSTSRNQPVPHRTAPEQPQETGQSTNRFVPVPNTAAASSTGVVLHVLAWGSGNAPQRLQEQIDLFTHNTGTAATVVMAKSEATYNVMLGKAFTQGPAPDILFVNAADFSGLLPGHDLFPVPPEHPGQTLDQMEGTFVRDGQLYAVPDEFSLDVLFYNEAWFDRAGLGYPGLHWTLDSMQAISRALTVSQFVDTEGKRIFALELPCDFPLLNLLSAEAGRPLLDRSGWHLSDPASHEVAFRALSFFQTFFRDLDVCAPFTNDEQTPGDLFAQGRACLLIAPIETQSRFEQNRLLRWEATRFPTDVDAATNLRVRGWAVSKFSRHPAEAAQLVRSLSQLALHDNCPSPHDTDWSDLVKMTVPHALFAPVDPPTRRQIDALTEQLQLFSKTHGDGATLDTLYHKLAHDIPVSGPLQVETGLPKAAKKR